MQFRTKGFVASALFSGTLALALTGFLREANAQYGAPYLVAAPQDSANSDAQLGQALAHVPGQQLQPYGFLWTGYNATVEYDIYGLRRMQQQSPLTLGGILGATRCLGDENNPCGDPDCSNCKSRSRGFFNSLINPFTRPNNCNHQCDGCNGDCCNGNCSKCQQQATSGSNSTERGVAVPQPVTNNDVVRISPSVPVPTPVKDWPKARPIPENDLPRIEPRQPEGPVRNRIPTTVAPNPAIDQVDPMPDPPEPTLHVPANIQPQLPRNRLPQSNSSDTESLNEEEPRSSRRPQRARTLAAVGQYIKS